MTNDKNKPTPTEALDELSHHAALENAENGKSSAADRKWSKELGANIEARLAEMRRNLTPADIPTEKAKPLRPSTIAMVREAVEAAIQALVGRGVAAGSAFRNLKELSDDDLRRLYDTIDPANRNPE